MSSDVSLTMKRPLSLAVGDSRYITVRVPKPVKSRKDNLLPKFIVVIAFIVLTICLGFVSAMASFLRSLFKSRKSRKRTTESQTSITPRHNSISEEISDLIEESMATIASDNEEEEEPEFIVSDEFIDDTIQDQAKYLMTAWEHHLEHDPVFEDLVRIRSYIEEETRLELSMIAEAQSLKTPSSLSGSFSELNPNNNDPDDDPLTSTARKGAAKLNFDISS